MIFFLAFENSFRVSDQPVSFIRDTGACKIYEFYKEEIEKSTNYNYRE